MVQVELKPLLRRLNAFCTRSLEAAAGQCISSTHYEVTVEHALLKMLEDPAADLARILEHFEIEPARVRRSLQKVLDGLRTGNAGKPVFSPILVQWIQDGWLLASIELSLGEIRSGALVAALTAQPERYMSGDQPDLARIPAGELRRRFMDVVAGSVEEARPETAAAGGPRRAAAEGGARPGGAESALGRFAINFTERARRGEIDPVFGRDREIRQMVDILARRRKNNPIVVGEAGVGKTAVVEGLAVRLAQGDVPDLLKGVEIFGLDMGLLQAGAGVKGEFENRLKNLIAEIKASPTPIITFIDEAHTLIGAGGAAGGSDAANLLKPALARGELRTIAATTWAEYKKYIEEDPALARRFQLVKLEEPSIEDAALILRGLKAKYEEVHKVRIRDDAVDAAARMSARYLAGRQLPDKAVDLLDTAAARVKIGLSSRPGALEDLERRIQALERERQALEVDSRGGAPSDPKRLAAADASITSTREELGRVEGAWRREKEAVDRVLEIRGRLEKDGDPPANVREEMTRALATLHELQGKSPLMHLEVNPDVVAHVVCDWTGIPAGKMVQDEASAVLSLEPRLKERIKGQDHAMRTIAEMLRSAKAGLADPGKPMGVFLLAGPSGVGKTETALTVAEQLFGGERFMVTINMSEFQDREMGVSGLVGARPGYVGYGKGGMLTEAVRQRPYCVVLLDEMEKAATEVRNLFFQVFDKGELTDGTGRTIDFKNTVIFITTNLGLETIQQLCAASAAPDPAEILAAVRPTLSKVLSPAWVARTTVIPYLTLPVDALRMITALKMNKVARRLKESHCLEMVCDDKVLDRIAERCTEVETGARNIDFILQGTLLPRISAAILERMASGPLPERLTVSAGEDGDITVGFAEM
jgi:type VI secretion system protein VasG